MDELHACESMVPLIVRYADGTLAAEDVARIEAHAASCASCREAIREQSVAATLLSELPMGDVSRDFAERVRARVAPAGGLLDILNWRAWTLRLAPVAALFALLAWVPGSTQSTVAETSTAAQIETWATGGANSTAALLVDAETDAGDLLAAAYAGESR